MEDINNKYPNLKPFKKGQSGNPNGRPRKISGIFGDIPRNAREEVYRVLYHALSLSSREEAVKFLQNKSVGKYGFVYQLTLNTLLSKNGWLAALDIFDRLFGKPRQQSEITVKGDSSAPEIIIGGGDVED